MPAPGLYGRRVPDPTRPALRLSRYLTGVVPDHPVFADYLAQLSGWQMLGNGPDPANAAAGVPPGGAGDCVSVTGANTRRLVTAALSTEYYWTLAQVIEFYKTQNPNFPADDNGMDIQTALGYLVSTGGPDGVKALGFAKVDHTNPDEVKAAIAIFGSVWTGINVQQAQETQFGDGQPWDYVSGSPDAGGHSIIVGGYGQSRAGALGGDEDFITWAQETSFTDTFWSREVEECWVVIWPEHLGSKEFLAGVDMPTFAADYQAITGQPFPVTVPPPPAPVPPTPTPTPTPVPVPTPPVPVPPDSDPADVALAQKVTHWALTRHHFGGDRAVAGDLQVWLRAKGFMATVRPLSDCYICYSPIALSVMWLPRGRLRSARFHSHHHLDQFRAGGSFLRSVPGRVHLPEIGADRSTNRAGLREEACGRSRR